MTLRDEALQVLTGLQNDSTYVELPREDMARSAIGDGDIPSSLDDLSHTVTRTYDLSVTAAGDLKIPVIGGVGGGLNRRVVLLERSSFAPVEHDKITYRYGYALRLAITVNKLSAKMQLSLPFLAASAEVGQIEGRWMLQVVGLAGAKIDKAILPPKELSVETFVLANQSLEKLISAVRDSSTSFSAAVIGVERPTEVLKKDYRVAVGRAYALGRIERGWSLKRAIDDLNAPSDVQQDSIADAYREFAGINQSNQSPPDDARRLAREVLEDVKVEAR